MASHNMKLRRRTLGSWMLRTVHAPYGGTVSDVGGERPRFTCMHCAQRRRRGVRFARAFLCLACERRLVRTSPSDPAYVDFVRKFRKHWADFEQIAAARDPGP